LGRFGDLVQLKTIPGLLRFLPISAKIASERTTFPECGCQADRGFMPVLRRFHIVKRTEQIYSRYSYTSDGRNKSMVQLKKSAIILTMVYLTNGLTLPALAQTAAKFEGVDDLSSSRQSKVANVDIVTDSPTLQNQSVIQQGQVNSLGGFVQQQNVIPAAPQYPYEQSLSASSTPGLSGQVSGQGSVAQSVSQQPIQVDPQTVGRVVGVAGTALLLGAFLKNGGVGGMMNTLGLDNRFRGRGSLVAPY
jgi:hypothetical protein